jgi:hypothetical protein
MMGHQLETVHYYLYLGVELSEDLLCEIILVLLLSVWSQVFAILSPA